MDEAGFTLADLARETGVAKGYLWEILDGRAKKPSANTLFEIAKVLGTSVGDLLGRETSKPIPAPKIPSSLQKLVDEEEIPDEDVNVLVAISFRGKQPKTKEDWRFLYESIKRSTRG